MTHGMSNAFAPRGSNGLLVAMALIVAGIALLMLAGCSGSGETAGTGGGDVDVRYASQLDSTTYQAGPVRVESNPEGSEQVSMMDARRSGQRRRRQRRPQARPTQTFTFSAQARCGGRGCTPTQVRVTIRLERARVRRGVPVSLQMGGREYEWESPPAVGPAGNASQDVVAVITMSWAQFQELAQSQTVAGSLGSIAIESPYEDRRVFRELLQTAGLN